MPKYIIDIDTDTLEATIKPVDPGQVEVPRYLRSLYHGHMREPIGLPREAPADEHADKIIEVDPADIYMWTQGPDKADVIAELQKRGKEVWYYLNVMHTHYQSVYNSYWGFHKIVGMTMKFWKTQLVDDQGRDLVYRWYGEGPILDWSKVTDPVMDWMISGG